MSLKVAIGIPSYQEADSISYVTRQIDVGLRRILDIDDCLIVNVDSNSSDNTTGVFLKTPTQCHKESFVIKSLKRGKGRNLLYFFQYCCDRETDFIVTIDADITTITPEWVEALLSPLMDGIADYVTPIYNRNRFEGSTTNHFAYPILHGFYGVDLRQPIAGEFALNRKLLNYLLQQVDSFSQLEIDALYGYGIDIFMSMHAAGGKFRIRQIPLTNKFHKPSFPKITGMFQEVATTAINVMRNYNFSLVTDQINKPENTSFINHISSYPHYHSAQQLLKLMQTKACQFEPVYNSWLEANNSELAMVLRAETASMSCELWTDILSGLIINIILSEINAAHILAEQLLPLFILRTVTFWNQSIDLSPEIVEQNIVNQSHLFSRKLSYSYHNKS